MRTCSQQEQWVQQPICGPQGARTKERPASAHASASAKNRMTYKHIFSRLFSNSVYKCGYVFGPHIYCPCPPELLPLPSQITIHLQTTTYPALFNFKLKKIITLSHKNRKSDKVPSRAWKKQLTSCSSMPSGRDCLLSDQYVHKPTILKSLLILWRF